MDIYKIILALLIDCGIALGLIVLTFALVRLSPIGNILASSWDGRFTKRSIDLLEKISAAILVGTVLYYANNACNTEFTECQLEMAIHLISGFVICLFFIVHLTILDRQ